MFSFLLLLYFICLFLIEMNVLSSISVLSGTILLIHIKIYALRYIAYTERLAVETVHLCRDLVKYLFTCVCFLFCFGFFCYFFKGID